MAHVMEARDLHMEDGEWQRRDVWRRIEISKTAVVVDVVYTYRSGNTLCVCARVTTSLGLKPTSVNPKLVDRSDPKRVAVPDLSPTCSSSLTGMTDEWTSLLQGLLLITLFTSHTQTHAHTHTEIRR